MADLENDVIAGIGEEQTATNVIYPTFDATFRQFVVGKDCILDGLELSPDGLTLTAGHCLGKGFQGELKNDIAFEAVPQKIYGRFVINHADDTLDHFYIETDPIIDTPKDDILTRKGEYWLLLYENSIMVVDRDYPENAVNSDTTIRLIEDGTIAESAEVEGDIKSGDTSDKTVASTAWVQKVITEQINLGEYSINFYQDFGNSLSTERAGYITLKRKARQVIAYIHVAQESGYSFMDGAVFAFKDNLPNEFFPTQNINFAIIYGTGISISGKASARATSIFNLSTKGEITRAYTAVESRAFGIGEVNIPTSFGYETNK